MGGIGEGDLIAAVQHIVAILGTKQIISEVEREILVDLRTRLTLLTMVDDSRPIEPLSKGESEIEGRLNLVSEKIMNRMSDERMIWEPDPGDASEYLKAVDEARILTKELETLCLDKNNEELELLRKARGVLQASMERLEEEFRHLMVQNSQPFEPEWKSFRSYEGDVEVGSPISCRDDTIEDSLSIDKSFGEFTVDLVNPDIIPDLKCIANLMLTAEYGRECCQAYVDVRQDALYRRLLLLEVEPLSIEDVLKMERVSLDSQIKRWVWAIKIFVRVYLSSEKRLSEEIFGAFKINSLSSLCFVESSKTLVMQLLSFGNAVAMGPRQPEKLSRVLDMYEVVVELLPDINSMYSEKDGYSVRDECYEVLMRLGDAVRAIFLEFKNAIAKDVSVNSFPRGGVHSLTRYVINYVNMLNDYSDTLNQILVETDREVSFHFRLLTSILEDNIEEKSKLYNDPALQNFFLMNNIHYMAEKVKNSELRDVFGDNWIRTHNAKFQQQAMQYERATWSSVLSLLRDDVDHSSSSWSSVKNVLKERLRRFYVSFEEIYKNQTSWLIKDPRLQDDLRISISLKVIPAYRNFVGRHVNEISDKYIKYTVDDLQNFLLDLFSGSQKSLSNIHRKRNG